MTTLEILNSTPKDRQLWYWRKEMESCRRYMSKMDFCGWLDDADVVIEAEGK